MTREEIISGLKFTVEMFLFDPATGEKYTEPRNDMDKTTIDACRGAIELLNQMRDATSEEQESVNKYIKSISKETGVKFGELEQEPCDVPDTNDGNMSEIQTGSESEVKE